MPAGPILTLPMAKDPNSSSQTPSTNPSTTPRCRHSHHRGIPARPPPSHGDSTRWPLPAAGGVGNEPPSPKRSTGHGDLGVGCSSLPPLPNTCSVAALSLCCGPGGMKAAAGSEEEEVGGRVSRGTVPLPSPVLRGRGGGSSRSSILGVFLAALLLGEQQLGEGGKAGGDPAVSQRSEATRRFPWGPLSCPPTPSRALVVLTKLGGCGAMPGGTTGVPAGPGGCQLPPPHPVSPHPPRRPQLLPRR